MLTFVTGCMKSGKTEAFLDAMARRGPNDVFALPRCVQGSRAEAKTARYEADLRFLGALPAGTRAHIDEVQFFPEESLSDVLEASARGVLVTCYGLRRNRYDEPYSQLTEGLLRHADEVFVCHHARCDVPGCQAEGYNSIIVGEHVRGALNVVDGGQYKVYCRAHWLETTPGLAIHERLSVVG